MDLEDLIGPLPAPLGRWLLRRMIASGVRYGHGFAVVLVRGADPAALAGILRGADIFAHTDEGDLLALLPDTDQAGGNRVAARVREATGGSVGVAQWGGDLAEDLLDRAARALDHDLAQA